MSPKAVENTERVSTYISEMDLQKLKEIASENGMTVSGYIRLLIKQDINRWKQEKEKDRLFLEGFEEGLKEK